ncbi:MAG: SUMF1/EgtB/PvdO family nonheme iron enzyme [Chloroflexota bacterium]|nr:SUMF1/EgtB/PvdO family nonheme iron enzyme [Chloroflexota bacterium]
MPRTLFISYRSSDAVKVDKIAKDLSLLKYDDGTPRYTTWQDKHNLPPASPNWWDAIVDAIEQCDMFVFNLSRASLMSDVCRAELEYAYKRNRPIIPVVLDDEFFLNAQSGKYDLPAETWALVPEWLGQAQFLFYVATEFYGKFQEAVAIFERNWPRDIPAPRPLNPDSKSVHGNNHSVYAAARDYAYRLAFADAEKHFGALVRRSDPLYADASAHWLERIRLYGELIEMVEQRSPGFALKRTWTAYEALPTEYLDGETFDPKELATLIQTIRPQPAPPLRPIDPVQAALARARGFSGRRNKDWEPFVATFTDLKLPDMSFCLVPAGTFQMGSEDGKYADEEPVHPQSFTEPYWLAQHPVTNAQWAQAVQAGAVPEPRDDSSLKWYRDRAMADCPVVGVTWFMARDFASWVGCRLPSEAEWEYGARGVESLRYPWGNEWENGQRVIWDKTSGGKPNSVKSKPEGVSWVGAMHLSGNVWEWTSSLYQPYPYQSEDGRENDTGDRTNVRRVLRGGSWLIYGIDLLRAACRDGSSPAYWSYDWGLRLARSS